MSSNLALAYVYDIKVEVDLSCISNDVADLQNVINDVFMRYGAQERLLINSTAIFGSISTDIALTNLQIKQMESILHTHLIKSLEYGKAISSVKLILKSCNEPYNATNETNAH